MSKRIDRHRFAPYLLDSVTSRINANAARLYQSHYGLGLGEWRVLAMLAVEPGAPIVRIAELSAIDQGAVSRSVFSLKERGLVEVVTNPSDRRRRSVMLTPAGLSLHDTVVERALEQEVKLLATLDPTERDELLRLLRKLHARLFDAAGEDPATLDAFG